MRYKLNSSFHPIEVDAIQVVPGVTFPEWMPDGVKFHLDKDYILTIPHKHLVADTQVAEGDWIVRDGAENVLVYADFIFNELYTKVTE